MDSSASFHLSPNKELFRDFKSGSFEKVYFANNKDLKIEGKGDVCIKTLARNKWTLTDVRYIPNLKKNLISISQLDSTSYATKFGKSSWKILKGAMVIARGTKSGTLYTTIGCMNRAAVAESTSSSSLCHNKLGHMSIKGMKMPEGVLERLKSVDTSPCENCVMSNQKRVSFTKTVRELKKSTGTTNQVGVEVELQNNSHSDVVADTQETPETIAGEPEVKQVKVEVELLKDSPSDVVADTQEPHETVAEKPGADQVTPEQVLKISSRAIRVSDRYVPLHYWLVTNEGERKPLDETLQLEDTTKWEQAMDDGMSRLQKCVALSSAEVEYVTLAEAGKEMIRMTDYLKELGKKQREKILQVDS